MESSKRAIVLLQQQYDEAVRNGWKPDPDMLLWFGDAYIEYEFHNPPQAEPTIEQLCEGLVKAQQLQDGVVLMPRVVTHHIKTDGNEDND